MSDKPTIDEQWEILKDHILLAPVVAYDMMTASLAGLFDNEAFIERLELKFRKGAEVHNGEWLTMDPAELIEEANEEILDLWIYILMYAHRANEEAAKNVTIAE
jgi:hypothetical protein